MIDDRPKLKLVGENGNIFNIIGRAKRAAQEAGWTHEQVQELQKSLMSKHSYDEVIGEVMEKFDVY